MGRDACFNVAHWEFAVKYLKIARDVPLILKGKIPEDSRSFQVFYYSVHAANIIVSVLSGADFIVYNFAVFHGKEPSSATITFSQIFHFAVGGAQLFSGVILLYALVVIAKELKANETGD